MTRPGHLSVASQLVLALLGAAPFVGVVALHFAAQPGAATGFIQADMPYYSANGRAVFERGNGGLYPNAYDPDPAAPVIYFHWFVWLLGFGIVKLGLDPGFQFVALGTTSAILCAWVTLRLVRSVLPESQLLRLLYLATMWGGGLFCLAAAAQNARAGLPLLHDLFRHDPAGGDWCLNWGRNLIYPTEATYHLLMALCWLGLIECRWLAALGSGVALAATQPFTGLQALFILGAWSGLRLVSNPSATRLVRCLAVAAALAAFAGYYGLYLESFPQHRALRQEWSLDWSLTARAEILGYGLGASLALGRVIADQGRIGRTGCVLATAFLVSFLLVNHDRFVAPRQPLHFTRGYVWMPLWLLALPLVQRTLVRLRTQMPAPVFAGVVGLGAAVLVSDNVAFVAGRWRAPHQGFYLSSAERDLFARLDRQALTGVLLCPDGKVSYLSAVYTPMRPFGGHPFLTPDYARRLDEMRAFFEHAQGGPWLRAIDYVLVRAPLARRTRALLEAHGVRWRVVVDHAGWVLLGRSAPVPGRVAGDPSRVFGLTPVCAGVACDFESRGQGRTAFAPRPLSISIGGRPVDLTLESDDGQIARLRCGAVLEQREPGGGADQLRRLLGPDAFSRRVVLDLGGVVEARSDGIAWLVGSVRRFAEKGGRLVVHSVPRPLAEAIKVMRLWALLHVARDEAAADAMALTQQDPPAGAQRGERGKLPAR